MNSIIETIPRKLVSKWQSLIDPRIGKLENYPPKQLHIPRWYTQQACGTGPYTISIVTPSFSSGAYIRETISSVLNQNYEPVEYIVQDGGSKDNTVEILQSFGDRLSCWESAPDRGQSHAINVGFSKSSGEVMAYLNADDLLLPGSLAFVSKFFHEHPEVDVVYGHRVLIDHESMEIGRWVMPPHCTQTITWHDFIPQETLFWRRSLWEDAGGYIDESKQFAMDWELIMRFRECGAVFKRLPRFLGAFRVHPDMKSIKNVNTVGVKEMDELRKKYHNHALSPKELEKYIRNYIWTHIFLDRLYRLGLMKY